MFMDKFTNISFDESYVFIQSIYPFIAKFWIVTLLCMPHFFEEI